tara:strand:+ start:6270 stop:6689 length:420 start_codon:yes stop_codon:yes gene_type:complete
MRAMTKITGDVAVDKMLGRLSDKGLRKVLISALRKVAKPIVKEVRKQVIATGSVDTGRFKKSIGVIPSKNKKIAVVYVGARSKGGNAFYFANLLEKGSDEMNVNFAGRKIFDKAYNATRLKGTNDIETAVINLIKKKIK